MSLVYGSRATEPLSNSRTKKEKGSWTDPRWTVPFRYKLPRSPLSFPPLSLTFYRFPEMFIRSLWCCHNLSSPSPSSGHLSPLPLPSPTCLPQHAPSPVASQSALPPPSPPFPSHPIFATQSRRVALFERARLGSVGRSSTGTETKEAHKDGKDFFGFYLCRFHGSLTRFLRPHGTAAAFVVLPFQSVSKQTGWATNHRPLAGP